MLSIDAFMKKQLVTADPADRIVNVARGMHEAAAPTWARSSPTSRS